jgi:hypothetical protein
MAISGLNIALQGIVGAVQGAGQAAYNSALEQQKQESERIREQRLSQLRMQEHATNTTYDLAAQKAAADVKAKESADFYAKTAAAVPGKGIIDQAQATYDTDEGTQTSVSNPVTTTVPPSRADVAAFRLEEAKKSGKPELIKQSYEEDRDVRANADQDRKNAMEKRRLDHEEARNPYYAAMARVANANADDIEENGRHRGLPPERPSIVEERDPQTGAVIGLLDKFSGARMRIIPGTPEVPAKSHVFGADEPGKPAVPGREEWTLGGKVLPNGIVDLYPNLNKKASAATAPKTAPAAPATAPASAGDESANLAGASAPAPAAKSTITPPATLPMPGGKGAAKFTGKFSPAGHPLYQGADGKLFEGR